MIAVFSRSTVLLSDKIQAIAFDSSPYHFNYIGWEVGAIRVKAAQTLFGLQAFMDEESRSQFVRDYMIDLGKAQQLEAQIEAMYTDPNIKDPESASQDHRIEKDRIRQRLAERQLTVEAILEGQVAMILVDEGFGIFGQLLPPIAMHFTQVPNLLVISPREQIQMDTSIALSPMSVEQRNQIETELDEHYEVSSLVVPLGGIALYPAMVIETSSIPFAVETFAHEWLHHYLYFHPLGISYFTGDALAGEARIINETTADLFGKEIARIVLQRYYPEQPLPPMPAYSQESTPPTLPNPDAFDFGAAMHETRAQVDMLLADGEIKLAEAYMEERRLFFFEQGYRIRKINQAFFAFYGGYQAGGGIVGAGGDDPIGPTLFALRAGSISLHQFVITVQGITDLNQLLSRLSQVED